MDGQKTSEGNSNEARNEHDGWTKDDKYELLQALKIHGSQDIKAINEMLPSKSPNEIIEMINYYKIKALRHLHEKKKETRFAKKISKVPLSIWAKLLTDTYNYSELQTETANAVRIIADCENFPHPATINNVNFRSIYHTIANAMEGKALPNDPLINTILQKCFIETAYRSKTFIRNSSLRNIINSVDLSEKNGNKFVRPTENYELLALRHLSTQKCYNPLNIDEEYLKPSVYPAAE